MNIIFDSVNYGFILAIIMGFLLLLIAIITAIAPDLLGEEINRKLSILNIPIIGVIFSLFGIGKLPLIFLLGIYPFIIGIIGLTGNLICLLWLNINPSLPIPYLTVRFIGLFSTIIFIDIVGNLRQILRTHTVQLIPERLIGIEGEVSRILANDILEVSVYDEIGRFSLHVFCLPHSPAIDIDFHIGNKVYLVDFLEPNYYSVVKLNSIDHLKLNNSHSTHDHLLNPKEN
ncbi:hypothetical protein [Geminocystis sp. GBBB08]|uniref:hypothetical protein n=1 Tax=Geminocystis sp. GBBB08 TaxID=2604140 RepID=UPI0027E24482|nr:hypothetical protein [Geminocystis sp. GBBB08]MBL1208371.1 hypothetical protein [Geminocystis sp. GBBB08]